MRMRGHYFISCSLGVADCSSNLILNFSYLSVHISKQKRIKNIIIFCKDIKQWNKTTFYFHFLLLSYFKTTLGDFL